MTDIHPKGHFYIITAVRSNYRTSQNDGYTSERAFLYNYSSSFELQGVRMWRRLQLKCDGTRWRTGGKWRGNWWMEWVASILHTTSEHVVSSITTADAHTSAANSRLNWRPRRFKWTRPFRRKTKSGFCACAITFQTQSTNPTRTLHKPTAQDNQLLVPTVGRREGESQYKLPGPGGGEGGAGGPTTLCMFWPLTII